MKNKVSGILEKRPDYIKDNSISFKSKVLRLVGYSLIGNPKSNGLSKDFYDMPADREMPNPKHFNQDALVKNVKANNIRRQILAKTTKFAFSILIFLFLIILSMALLQNKKTSLPSELNKPNISNKSNNNTLGLKDCNQVLDTYYYGNRSKVSKNDMIRCNVEAQ